MRQHIHYGPMSTTGGALGIWEQTSMTTSKTRILRTCLRGCASKINKENSMLDQLTAEQVKVRASGTSTSQAAEATNSIEKPFSHWIRGAPKEKWSFNR